MKHISKETRSIVGMFVIITFSVSIVQTSEDSLMLQQRPVFSQDVSLSMAEKVSQLSQQKQDEFMLSLLMLWPAENDLALFLSHLSAQRVHIGSHRDLIATSFLKSPPNPRWQKDPNIGPLVPKGFWATNLLNALRDADWSKVTSLLELKHHSVSPWFPEDLQALDPLSSLSGDDNRHCATLYAALKKRDPDSLSDNELRYWRVFDQGSPEQMCKLIATLPKEDQRVFIERYTSDNHSKAYPELTQRFLERCERNGISLPADRIRMIQAKRDTPVQEVTRGIQGLTLITEHKSRLLR